MSEWVHSTVGEVTVYQRAGGTPSVTVDEYYGGEIPFVSIEDITKSTRFLDKTEKRLSEKGLLNSAAWLIKEPHILYSMYATVGKPIINHIHCATNQAIIALKESSEIEQSFLYYQLLFIRPQVYKYTSQTTQSNLNAGSVKKLSISYPKDRRQQQKIVAILSSIDVAIEKTEALIVKYQQIKAGLMHDLFTRGVTSDGKLRPPREQAPELYHETPIGWIPKEWEARLIVNAVSQKPNAIVDGPFGSNLKTIHYRTSGIPVIQSGYVTSGIFQADEYFYVTESHFQTQSRSRVNPGDIVMAKIGAQAGMCAVLPEEHSFGILAGNSLKITADNSILQRDWLVAYLQRLYIVTGMRGIRTETAQPAISIGRLKKLLVPVPKESEQIYGTKAISAINQNLTEQIFFLAKLRQQKLGLMHDLLTGKISVTPISEKHEALA